MNLINDASQKIAGRLTWHTANRDQAGIAKDIADGNDIPEVYGLGEAGLFDEFFCFLDRFGFKDLFMRLDPKSKQREPKSPLLLLIVVFALLWWLNSEGITFYIPAKSNMNVYEDALSLVNTGCRATRTRNRNVGYGKNKTVVADYWEVVGIEELTSAGFYGPHGSGSHENSKDFVPNPINAAVVLHDPYKENNPNSKTMVILTNGDVNKPLKIYDGYDARSEIENSMFREAKQAWFIERHSQNNKAGFRVHAYLTILTMAMTTAYQCWMDQQDELEKDGQDTGIRKSREKLPKKIYYVSIVSR